MALGLYCQKPQKFVTSEGLEDLVIIDYSEDKLTPKIWVKTISCR